jgi:LmbE family N-acetylglucosaminyl deacetylase
VAALLDEPRWAPAAQALVDGCIDLHDDEDRVALLAAVCEGLGDELYPAFLRVLWTVGRHGDHAACAAVARALVHALRTGRLPSGRRSAWGEGASAAPPSAFGRVRSLGPLEYLCAWHAQADPVRALSSAQFHLAARALMDLVDASPDARALYCEKLLADADDPLPGALTRQTREALRALATAWVGGAAPFEACGRFTQALPGAVPRPVPPLLHAGGAGWAR